MQLLYHKLHPNVNRIYSFGRFRRLLRLPFGGQFRFFLLGFFLGFFLGIQYRIHPRHTLESPSLKRSAGSSANRLIRSMSRQRLHCCSMTTPFSSQVLIDRVSPTPRTVGLGDSSPGNGSSAPGMLGSHARQTVLVPKQASVFRFRQR